MSNAKNRVLSGMRPTGRLHIGHYFGALQNWVKLQNDVANDCYFFIADWHALTSDYADSSAIAENSLQITIDYLAAGIDPKKSVVFLQSLVPEHAELHLLLSMVTPLGWLERIPTYKEQIENVNSKDLHTYGFLGYPTLQTADIVLYSDPGKSLSVPVGEDQVSHVEFSRELVRKFNFHYGLEISPGLFEEHRGHKQSPALAVLAHIQGTTGMKHPTPGTVAASPALKSEMERIIRDHAMQAGVENFLESIGEYRQFFTLTKVLEEPGVLLTPTPRIPGLDGRKMSKSYGNAITLSESDSEIRSKTKTMVTDPARKRRTDPGNPDVCPVYDWHKLFSTEQRDPGRLEWVQTGCRTAGIGCIECKDKMASNLIHWIEPVRDRRVKYHQNQKEVLEILDHGSQQAQQSARKTLERVRHSIFNWPRKRQEIIAT